MTSLHSFHFIRAKQRGRSLVELLVTLLIGLLILTAVLLTTSGTNFNGRRSDSQSRLDEDAQLILNLLVPQLQMAGYSSVSNNGIAANQSQPFAGPGVRGCDNGFTNTAAAVWTGNDTGSAYSNRLACNAGTGSPSIAVLYEADNMNTVPDAAGRPTDCLGNSIASVASSMVNSISNSDPVFVAENRYYLIRPAGETVSTLYCRGNGNNTPEPLVDNIEQMTITYGVGENATTDDAKNIQVLPTATQLYQTAAQIDGNLAYAGDILDRWRRVTSVTICVVLRGQTADAPAATPFQPCIGNANATTVTTPAASDRFLRKTVRATVVLRNRT